MLESRKEHKIKQVHGAPRSPTIQDLVEHNNRTVKEKTNGRINENNDEKANWCKILNEAAAYKKNTVEHNATGRFLMKQCLEFCPEKNYMQIPLKKNLVMKAVQIQTRGNIRRITLKGRN